MTAPHLLVAISPHGFGHLAQCAPVINALRERLPALRLTLRTTVPRATLERRITGPFELQTAADDFGMVQHDAFTLNLPASAQRYREFHRDWEARVGAVAAELRTAAADLVLADVPYLTLAGAQRAGIESVAMCCLNWAEIYGHYFADRPEADTVLAQMRASYLGARSFLRTEPAMPMAWLSNAVDVGPVMSAGRDHRLRLEAFGITAAHRLVLVALGGIHTRPPMEQWPHIPGVRYLVQADWAIARDDVVTLEATGLAFSDLLASCDLLITKPGYGSFTEAAACGVPVLWVDRGDWPEQPALVEWLARKGHAAHIDRDRFDRGDLSAPITALLARGRFAPVAPTGVAQAADHLADLLS